MQQGIRLTFKGQSQKTRRNLIKILEHYGLKELNSQHDDYNNRHSHEFYIDGDIELLENIDESEFDDFKAEAGVGC